MRRTTPRRLLSPQPLFFPMLQSSVSLLRTCPSPVGRFRITVITSLSDSARLSSPRHAAAYFDHRTRRRAWHLNVRLLKNPSETTPIFAGTIDAPFPRARSRVYSLNIYFFRVYMNLSRLPNIRIKNTTTRLTLIEGRPRLYHRETRERIDQIFRVVSWKDDERVCTKYKNVNIPARTCKPNERTYKGENIKDKNKM